MPAQVALSWMLNKPFVTSIIVGASSVRQLENNFVAAELDLGNEEIQELDEMTAPVLLYPNWMIKQFPDQFALTLLEE